MLTAIEGEGYRVHGSEQGDTVVFEGVLRLGGMSEYAPIADLLRTVLDGRDAVTLDLRRLEFLNSSGIAMLSKFVIEARNREEVAVTIKGSSTVPWQGKSLKNLQRLMDTLSLELV